MNEPKVRHLLTVAFEGTAYAGWQAQGGSITVQQRVEEALAKIFPSKPRVHSSSRTDTGVHALGMMAHFDVGEPEFRMLPQKAILAINAHLPSDIRVTKVTRVSLEFHARFDALSKQYRYSIWNHPAHHPLLRNQCWHFPKKLDIETMRKASDSFVGEHDFRAFSTTTGYRRENTVRTVTRCEIRHRGPLIIIIIEGDGFLYRMCRGIVGTLVQVGVGQHSYEEIGRMFESQDRRLGGMTAPALGLVLWSVKYKTRTAKSWASRTPIDIRESKWESA